MKCVWFVEHRVHLKKHLSAKAAMYCPEQLLLRTTLLVLSAILPVLRDQNYVSYVSNIARLT